MKIQLLLAISLLGLISNSNCIPAENEIEVLPNPNSPLIEDDSNKSPNIVNSGTPKTGSSSTETEKKQEDIKPLPQEVIIVSGTTSISEGIFLNLI